jgi:type IV fimbrial biogenesis protein FimT
MRPRGFTLVELLVVVSLIGLLLAAGGPALGSYISNAKLRTVAEQMRDGLRQARTEAIRRNTPINFVPGGTGWSVVLPAAGQDAAVTLASRTAYANEDTLVATASTTQVAFNGAGRLTTSGPFTVTLTTQAGASGCAAAGGSARCLNVIAVRGGDVRVCDPALATGKPEAC